MGINLQLLGMQAIPRIAENLGVNVEFPSNALIMSMQGPEEFKKLSKKCGSILEPFLDSSQLSWWDVYSNSDIGLERMAVAQEMQLTDKDAVLDVGCGRGYFSIATARQAKSVVGVDLMNGYGRHGWWKNFRESIQELNLSDKVQGLRSDAEHLPFTSNSFTIATSVHAIRNFDGYNSVEATIREMKRVIVDGGRVVIVESLPVASSKAQEAHLEMFRVKARYTGAELEYPSKDQVVGMFREVGFTRIEINELNYTYSAAPPVFCIKPFLSSLPSSERNEAKKAYETALAMVKKWGETSPPALLVTGTK